MKRFYCLAVLVLLSSSAHAGNSYSFVVAGHRIRIEAPRDCRSTSCVSVSIPGVYQTGRRQEKNNDSDRVVTAAPVISVPAPTVAVAPAPISVPVVAAKPPVASVVTVAPAPVVAPAIVQPVVTSVPAVGFEIKPVQQPVPPPAAVQAPPVAVMPPSPAPVQKPIVVAPSPIIAPRVQIANAVVRENDDTPVGDWQTEGNKGSVRIERCGQSLCGYVLDLASDTKGETVLIDMKQKTMSEWAGNIFSRASGNTYYATIAMKDANSLRVEACALGHFFCSGNVWSRIDIKPSRMVTSRQFTSGT